MWVRISVVPTGLKWFSCFTQHSAYGFVLGCTEPPLRGGFSVGLHQHRNPSLIITNPQKPALLT